MSTVPNKTRVTVRSRIIEFLMEPYKAEKPGSVISELSEILVVPQNTMSFEVRKLLKEGIAQCHTFGISKHCDEIWLVD